MKDSELAQRYESQNTSDFDGGDELPLTVRRDVTISVRFSQVEIADLRARADEAGAKVTSYIRAAALEASEPLDRSQLDALARDLEARAREIAELIARSA